jgi:hypothetical protein
LGFGAWGSGSGLGFGVWGLGFGYRVGAGVATAEELVEGVLAVAVRDEAHARAREPSVAERGDVEHLVRVGLGLGLRVRVGVGVGVGVGVLG